MYQYYTFTVHLKLFQPYDSDNDTSLKTEENPLEDVKSEPVSDNEYSEDITLLNGISSDVSKTQTKNQTKKTKKQNIDKLKLIENEKVT